MFSPIEMMVCCAVLAAPPPGIGDDTLDLMALSPVEANSLIDEAMFAGEYVLSPFKPLLSLGPVGGPPASSLPMTWTNDLTYGWSLTWDSSLQELALGVRESATDVHRVEWTVSLDGFSGLLFQALANDSSVTVDNWVLDGRPFDQNLIADAASGRMDLLLTDYDWDTDWDLKGSLTFRWDGSLPDSALASFSIFGTGVPVPSAALLLVVPLLTGTRRRLSR